MQSMICLGFSFTLKNSHLSSSVVARVNMDHDYINVRVDPHYSRDKKIND